MTRRRAGRRHRAACRRDRRRDAARRALRRGADRYPARRSAFRAADRHRLAERPSVRVSHRRPDYGATGACRRATPALIRCRPNAATLADILAAGDTFQYDYVLGEDWEHTVTLLSRGAAATGVRYPHLVSAQGRCPPADIGGPVGYETYLRSIADPASVHHADMLDFDAPDFDPHIVDEAALRANLAELRRNISAAKPQMRAASARGGGESRYGCSSAFSSFPISAQGQKRGRLFRAEPRHRRGGRNARL